MQPMIYNLHSKHSPCGCDCIRLVHEDDSWRRSSCSGKHTCDPNTDRVFRTTSEGASQSQLPSMGLKEWHCIIQPRIYRRLATPV